MIGNQFDKEQLKKLEYVGAGYFRIKAPKGKKSPIIHAPELLLQFISVIEKLDE